MATPTVKPSDLQPSEFDDYCGTIDDFTADIVAELAGIVGSDVESVNGSTGVVVLDAGDVGADVAGAAAAAQAYAIQRANHTGSQAQSTVTDLVTDLAAKAPLASPALTGNPTAPTQTAGNNSTRLATTAYVDTATALKSDKIATVGAALGTTGSVDLDLAALNNTLQSIALSGNITFTSSNEAAGLSVVVKISAASLRTLTFPSWTFLGPIPASIAAGKTGVLSLTAFGATDADVIAAWSVQS